MQKRLDQTPTSRADSPSIYHLIPADKSALFDRPFPLYNLWSIYRHSGPSRSGSFKGIHFSLITFLVLISLCVILTPTGSSTCLRSFLYY
ncbi:hypothetical protein BJX76DRAFT_331177 [Aspergillus varians]